MPIYLAKELADYNHVACLITSPERMVADFYGREDHREYIECIMSLENAEKVLEHDKDCFRKGTQEIIDDVIKSNLFYIMRDENSTVEKTLNILENHFNL